MHNLILIKVNQIGTLSETIDAAQLATEMCIPVSSATDQVRPRYVHSRSCQH